MSRKPQRDAVAGAESAADGSAAVADAEAAEQAKLEKARLEMEARWRAELQERLLRYRTLRAQRLGQPEGDAGPAPAAGAPNVIPFSRRRRLIQSETPNPTVEVEAVDANARAAEASRVAAQPAPESSLTADKPAATDAEESPLHEVSVKAPTDEEPLGEPVGEAPVHRQSELPPVSGPTVVNLLPSPALATQASAGLHAPNAPTLDLAAERASESESDGRLADPVLSPSLRPVRERVRLEVRESSGALRIEIPLRRPEPIVAPEFELPLPVASASSRLRAARYDSGWLLLASALFVATSAAGFYPTGPGAHALPGSMTKALAFRALLPIAIAGCGFLCAAYVGGFMALVGATPGMCREKLKVRTFEGDLASAGQLRLRALGCLLSLGALGLGYFWMLADADRMTWHDHISRTFIAED